MSPVGNNCVLKWWFNWIAGIHITLWRICICQEQHIEKCYKHHHPLYWRSQSSGFEHPEGGYPTRFWWSSPFLVYCRTISIPFQISSLCTRKHLWIHQPVLEKLFNSNLQQSEVHGTKPNSDLLTPVYQQCIWTAWDCLDKYFAPALCLNSDYITGTIHGMNLMAFSPMSATHFLCSGNTWSFWPLWTSCLIYIYSLNYCPVLWGVFPKHLVSFTFQALSLSPRPLLFLKAQQYLAIFNHKYWGHIYLIC